MTNFKRHVFKFFIFLSAAASALSFLAACRVLSDESTELFRWIVFAAAIGSLLFFLVLGRLILLISAAPAVVFNPIVHFSFSADFWMSCEWIFGILFALYFVTFLFSDLRVLRRN